MSSKTFDLTLRVAHAYVARGNYEAASKLVESALLEEPMNAEVYRLWGHILVARNRVEDAVFAFETAASFGPMHPEHHFELAEAFLNLAEATHIPSERFTVLGRAWQAANEGLRIAPEDLIGRALIDRIEMEQDDLRPPVMRKAERPSRTRAAALLFIQLGPAIAYILMLNGVSQVPTLTFDELLVATALILLMTVVVRLVYVPREPQQLARA